MTIYDYALVIRFELQNVAFFQNVIAMMESHQIKMLNNIFSSSKSVIS